MRAPPDEADELRQQERPGVAPARLYLIVDVAVCLKDDALDA